MRYVIVNVLRDEAGIFNNKLRQKVWEEMRAKSSKLPAHFTIKAPFEWEGNLDDLEEVIKTFSLREKAQPFRIEGYDHFGKRVIYMKVNMSNGGKEMHDRLIEEMEKIPYIMFNRQDGKDKVFHVTISSKKLEPIYEDVWEYVNKYPCEFDCIFDNISIYKWQDETWVLHKCFELR